MSNKKSKELETCIPYENEFYNEVFKPQIDLFERGRMFYNIKASIKDIQWDYLITKYSAQKIVDEAFKAFRNLKFIFEEKKYARRFPLNDNGLPMKSIMNYIVQTIERYPDSIETIQTGIRKCIVSGKWYNTTAESAKKDIDQISMDIDLAKLKNLQFLWERAISCMNIGRYTCQEIEHIYNTWPSDIDKPVHMVEGNMWDISTNIKITIECLDRLKSAHR